MSYDLEVGVKIAGADELYVRIARPEYDTPTYNLSKMFRACMDWDYNQSEWYSCTEVLPKIERGILELRSKPKRYEEYEPPNGWGTRLSAILALESLRDCIYAQMEDFEIPLECLYMRW